MSAISRKSVQSERRNCRHLKSLMTAVAAVGLFAVGAFAEEPVKFPNLKVAQRGKATSAEDWHIQIVPGPAIGRSPRVEPATRNAPSSKDPASRKPVPATEPESEVVNADATGGSTPRINPAAYAEVYNSIPFSRTEYQANREYRHEATLEILFGQMRPKTIVRSGASLGTSRASYSVQSVGRPGGAAPYPYWSPMLPASMGYWQPY